MPEHTINRVTRLEHAPCFGLIDLPFPFKMSIFQGSLPGAGALELGCFGAS